MEEQETLILISSSQTGQDLKPPAADKRHNQDRESAIQLFLSSLYDWDKVAVCHESVITKRRMHSIRPIHMCKMYGFLISY